MNKLPALKSRDIIRVLERIGFIEHRQKVSHKILKKGNLRITVPVHPGDLKKATVHSIVENYSIYFCITPRVNCRGAR